MESRYTEMDRRLMVCEIMNLVLLTEDGLRWCRDYGVVRDIQGGFSLADYQEEPVRFDLDRATDVLLQEYDDERTDWLIGEIEGEEMYSVFCTFQEILFGTCWIF